MSEYMPQLKVRVLGGFSATYEGEPLVFGRNMATKAMRLLQILIYHGEKGIARENLLEVLYGREELADASNNLRVTVHRLKKILTEAGLPPYDYVNIKRGIYQFHSPMSVEIDAKVFEKLVHDAERTEDEEEKVKLLKEACELYKGELLPDMSGDEWVLIENIKYKNMYTEALRELSALLMAREEYKETLHLCKIASEMYPFDEWQSVSIECYIALGQFKEAMEEYEKTAKLFFEELGVGLSEKMMAQFEIMSKSMNYKPQEIREIKENLKEEKGQGGAFYCSLPSFRDSYRLISRIVERYGQSVYLMQCNITNGKGQPLENEKKLELLSDELHNAIQHSLRRGDCFTKYSASQFLILLVGTNKENCSIIYERITKYFAREHKSWEQYLDYVISSIADVNQGESAIQFYQKPIW